MKAPWLILLLFSLTAFKHPMHVSVCEIEYDDNTKALEITQRIFIDDLEKEMRGNLGKPELNILKPPSGTSTDQLLAAYLQKKFKLHIDGKEKDIVFLGHEVEVDAIWCYMEVDKVKKVRKLKISNTILVDTFDDQANLIHIKYHQIKKSMKLSATKRHDEITFDR